MPTAITRRVSPRLAECEVSGERQPIDAALAARQHAVYEAVLAELGARVVSLPALADHPDGCFVEDPAVALDEVAVVGRMGAPSRRGETESLARELEKHRKLLHMEEPATLEGGDVMRAGKTLYVGLSRRTNVEGIRQLARLLQPYGYWVTPVEVRGCLHLKTACCYLGGGEILANRSWIDMDAFCGLRVIDVPAEEPRAANVLRAGETLVMPSAFPRTRERLEAAGYRVRAVDVSEFLKADAGVTCLSLLLAP